MVLGSMIHDCLFVGGCLAGLVMCFLRSWLSYGSLLFVVGSWLGDSLFVVICLAPIGDCSVVLGSGVSMSNLNIRVFFSVLIG